MMINKPSCYLVAGPPRSGTSMTAGLLAVHGVQAGHFKGPHADNPKGGFENWAIKQLLKAILADHGYGLNPIESPGPYEFNPVHVFRQHVVDQFELGQPWLFKEFRILMTQQLWAQHFPEAVYVLPRRDKASTLASMINHRSVSKRGNASKLAGWIDWSWSQQERIANHHPHMWVDVERLWAGDMGYIKGIIEGLGLEYDRTAAEAWIEPGLNHHSPGARR